MITAGNRIESIPLGSLKRYLVAAGWRRLTLSTGIEVFSSGPESDEIEIILPATSNARDLSERLTNAVATLTALGHQTIDEIVTAVRAIGYDLIRSKLPNAIIRHDTISLKMAEEFVKRMKKILAASAQGELHVSPYFIRIDNFAQLYADECRFGHTFRGSFGFTVESPVGPNTIDSEGVMPSPAPPLERRVMQRFARGLRIIETAIEKEDPSQIVNGYESGLNANACEDLSALMESPHLSAVTFEIVFSPEWGVSPDLEQARAIEIRKANGIEIIKEAAKALRLLNSEKLRTVVGKVRTLHSMETPANLFSISGLQDIVVEWESEEFGKRNVRVSLGPEEYLQAVEAHTTGHSISVYGELVQGRQWRLDNPRDFRIVGSSLA